MKPMLYWSSMSTTRCSVSRISSYFFSGTVMSAMEIVMAITILGAILASIALLICGSVEKFCCQWESFSIDAFMANAFLIVMGIEFVKMLALHTADAVVDVLLFTIVRQMIVSHTDAAETLLGVAAVAGIFAVKKYLQARENAA